MSEKRSGENVLTIPAEWHIRYEYAAGEVTSRFLTSLKMQRKILATKCSKCGLVMLPPRAYCERCFVPVEEWVSVGNTGVIEAATIVCQKFENLPEPPYAIAYVRLDGADTALINFVEGLDLSDVRAAAKALKPGTKVRVRFKDRPEGRITDFHYELTGE